MASPALLSLPSRTDTGYKRGRAFSVTLYRVQTNPEIWLETRTAIAFLAMKETAWNEAGLDLRLSQGFRTMAEQTAIYDERYTNGTLNAVGRAKGPAAPPGKSNHQAGEAIDANLQRQGESSKFYKWLDANAQRFGFKRTVSLEPWHWEYDGSFVAQAEAAAADVATHVQQTFVQTAEAVLGPEVVRGEGFESPSGPRIGLIAAGAVLIALALFEMNRRR